MKKFSSLSLLEHGEQITEKGNRVQSTNFILESKTKVEGLITYSIDQKLFKFKVIIGHKDPLKTINLDELNNLELWGANVDLQSYDKKWTIHDIIQNMDFHCAKANPCVMMRENIETNCCKYIAVHVDDLYISKQNLKTFSTLSKPNAN